MYGCESWILSASLGPRMPMASPQIPTPLFPTVGPVGPGWLPWALLFALGLSFPTSACAQDAVAPVQVPTLLPLLGALLQEAPQKPPRWQPTRGRPLQYMLELYRQSADPHGRPRENRIFRANAVRLVKPKGRRALHPRGPWYVQTLDFPLQPTREVYQLMRAAIAYQPRLRVSHSHLSCYVEPWAHESTVLLGGGSPGFTLPEAWAEMDLTSYIRQQVWPQKGRRVLHIQVRCQQQERTEIGLGWRQVLATDTAFLVLYFNNTFKSVPQIGLQELPEGTLKGAAALSLVRRVRQVDPMRSKVPGRSPEQTQCSLHPFQVSFRQLGWDNWIIAPHLYNPNYCKGACPRVLRSGLCSPNHAIIQNLINELVDGSIPRPSCVPHKYSAISVLLIEASGSILYKEYEDMIAQSCTCR
ncbi:bone morphogenetic protein 15 [Dromiciops gliroides]|uniref:bone morphogenetic protein 15 n=1 Tax=Dromiciops gliroides TaxID=33562 RepID=UPI001CC8143D|nr:bone morphogenetic protein 15 [Dromiciops gliroides]